MRIEKGHHRLFVRSAATGAAAFGTTLIPICQSGFVAMVAIGNNQFLRGHRSHDLVNDLSIEHRPDTVDHAIFILGLVSMGMRCNFVAQAINLALRIAVEHEKLPSMSSCVT